MDSHRTLTARYSDANMATRATADKMANRIRVDHGVDSSEKSCSSSIALSRFAVSTRSLSVWSRALTNGEHGAECAMCVMHDGLAEPTGKGSGNTI